MADVFSQILNMSLTGSIAIGVVILARFCMRKLPKIFSYALWSVVLFRLMCPFSISGPGSLLELLKPRVQETTDIVSVVSYLPVQEELPEFQYISAEVSETRSVDPEEQLTPMDVFSRIWITGAGTMGIYAVVQYLLLRKRLVGTIQYRDSIYLADNIDTAFVMGIVFPKIFLPSHVPTSERKYILAHERHHIRRGDHVIKLLAYLTLCVHWFNPLVWAAFLLAGKDMEMSCDEAVIRQFGSGIRAEYSASLLRLAAHRRPVPGMPLAFGEGDTKGRIMNMAKWKKPKLWASALCGILCIAVLAACAVNPRREAPEAMSPEGTVPSESSYMETVSLAEAKVINVLLTILPEDAEAAKLGNSMLLLKLDEAGNGITVQSIPGDKVVDLPDYRGHTTGYQPVQTGYALGYVWGGRAAAMEMTNLCLRDSFGIQVDYLAEMGWDEVRALLDRTNGISIPAEAEELEDLSQLDNAILADVQPGMVAMDANTAVAYAYPRSSEEDAQVADRSRLRQRKLLASVLSLVRGNPALVEGYLPPLYRADDLEGTPADWSEVLNFLESHTSIYLEGNEQSSDTNVPDLDVVTDAELIQYGALKLQLPQGYTSYAKGNEVILDRYGTDVGGIRCYRAPGIPLDYSIEYLRAMGLPEAQETDEPIAYMISNNIGGGIVAEFFHELKPETLNVEHNFYFVGDLVYDVYFDQNILSDVDASKFLKTIELNGTPIEPAKPEEEESLILCRNVIELVRAGAYQIAANRENQGDYALNRYSDTVYTALGEDWVSITHVPDDDSYHGYMFANGQHYSNEGSAWDENGNVNWQEDPYPDEVYVPWIASFQWDPELITYIDTILENGRKTVMLRIDEPMKGYEKLTECYFVNVHFTEGGSFLNAEIMIDFIWENDLSSVEITEAIITMDENIISTYIENEYTRAVSGS